MKRAKKYTGVSVMVALLWVSLTVAAGVAFPFEAAAESEYLQEAVRTRQMLRTALEAAQNDYSQALWNDKVYLPAEGHEVFASEANGVDAISGSEGTLKGSQTSRLQGEVWDWIPARYKTTKVENLADDAEWVLVREEPGKNSRILGRYAYVCFDCSGALDANFVALANDVGRVDARAVSNRMRRSIRDVPMGLLPEVTDAGQFMSYRRGWKGFDNLQMLKKLTDGKVNDGSGVGSVSTMRWSPERSEVHGAGLLSNLVSELASYSLSSYRGGRYSRNSGSWEKPKYVNPDDGSGWKNALSPLRGQLKVDDVVFEKMVKDFTSKEIVPEGVDYPSVKNVPMFNEIIVKNLHLNAPWATSVIVDEEWVETYEYTATVEVQFEFWYPFPSKENEQSGMFRLQAPILSMASYPSEGAQIAMPVALIANGKRIVLHGNATVVDPASGVIEVPAKYNAGKPYVTPAVKYRVTFATNEEIDSADGQLEWRGWQTQQDIDLTYGGVPVDRMPKGVGRSLHVVIPAGQDDPGERMYSKEVCDPRLNHLASEWQDAWTVGGTPGGINECTAANEDYLKEGGAMYCRNGPMETPADFGFFPTGTSWNTIDLLNDEGADFLALTTMDTNLYEAIDRNGVFYTNAQLNVNTRCSNALASAFYGISVMDVPGWDASQHDGTDSMDESTAREMARRIIGVTQNSPFQSGLDWAGVPSLMGDNGYLASLGYNRNQRESLLRNTYGLFSVADNLFTVVVVAQSIKEGKGQVGTWDDGDQVTGERRAVALVWRDPFLYGHARTNEMMVRAFRSLDVGLPGSTTNTPVEVPYEWLAKWPGKLAAHGGDYESFAADTAANGRKVWECYVADLDPTDAESELRVGLERDEEGAWRPIIVSGESAGRRYEFEGAEELPVEDGQGEWKEVEKESRFFRARVTVGE